MKRQDILDGAGALIHGQRASDYGDAVETHARIGRLWSEVLGVEVRADQVAICMALVKVARLTKSPDHEDNYLDAVGYLAIAGECRDA